MDIQPSNRPVVAAVVACEVVAAVVAVVATDFVVVGEVVVACVAVLDSAEFISVAASVVAPVAIAPVVAPAAVVQQVQLFLPIRPYQPLSLYICGLKTDANICTTADSRLASKSYRILL